MGFGAGPMGAYPASPVGHGVSPGGPQMRGIGGIGAGVAPIRPYDGEHQGTGF